MLFFFLFHLTFISGFSVQTVFCAIIVVVEKQLKI